MPVRAMAFLLAALLVLWSCKGEHSTEAKPVQPGKSKPPFVQLSPLAITEAGVGIQKVPPPPPPGLFRAGRAGRASGRRGSAGAARHDAAGDGVVGARATDQLQGGNQISA